MHTEKYPELVAAFEGLSKRGRHKEKDHPSKKMRQLSFVESMKVKFSQKKARELYTR